MNDVMTDRIFRLYTEYLFSLKMSISSFVGSCQVLDFPASRMFFHVFAKNQKIYRDFLVFM